MKLSRNLMTVFATAAIAACGGSSEAPLTGEQTGSLSLRLADAPVENVSEVWVSFSGVSIRREGDEDASEIIFDSPRSVDLLTLIDGNTETLLSSEPLPVGRYDQLRLLVNAEFDGVFDSYVITDAGGQVELRVPSGSQSGLKLINDIVITNNQSASFLLDWDVRKGLVNPRGQPGYFLKPTIRVIDDTEFGTLVGSVAVATLEDETCTNDLATDEGSAVYIFAGRGTTPTDIAGLETDPVATVAVRQGDNGVYGYEAILTPGDYTVAFTCQAGDDDPDVDQSTVVPEGGTEPVPLVFVTNDNSDVTVVVDGEVVVDF